ncbi:alpha/beta fold hydrolase [Prochlorococcus marinus]|uniref:Predicted hydrolase or acyltransferase n=1 Tax=Prochlorococcus marinus (strain MIT 9303) TaxID=59922 RepID=A2CBI7_PROM3|nr:alpha/beta hydrolase [Prochlorococcus marinus]ABM78847.1 Predicted hydrolase or acyltransferase [Prochlorococcus marinus str. MIT 9303]
MLQKLIILSSLCWPLNAFAQVNFTEINGSILHSQYYPNANAKFKGTILFQNGSGTSLKEWTENKTFFECIKQHGNLFMYDRSGLGESSPDFSISLRRPITAQLVNYKLLKLLKRNHIKSPYILVSHSYGGMHAGYFARKYPDSVVGMLMVDPVPSNYQYSNRIQKQFEIALTNMDKISSREAYKLHSFSRQNKGNMMTADSFYQQKGFHKSLEQVAKLPRMSSMFPIIIASSTYMDKKAPIKGSWYNLQKQWLNQNPNSIIFKVNSGHFIQLTQPKLICEQLNQIVKIATQSSKSKR